MVDLDAPDDVRFPQWSGASGYMVLALVQALGACPFVQAQLGAHLRCRKVELEAGEALYIPPLSQRHSIILVVHCCDSKEIDVMRPYWWHHVQSLTPETTSMVRVAG